MLRRTVCRSTATVCRSTARLSSSIALSQRAEASPLNFAKATTAFQGTSTVELLRGAAVLTACSQPWLVHHAKSTIDASYRLFGRRATEAVLRHTAFAHFVAGESAEEIAPKLQALRDVGVGGILDYAAEASLDEDDAPPHGVNQPARVYPFQNEEVCEENKRIFIDAVDAVHATTPEGFAAVKVTALGDPMLLERVSAAIVQLHAFFDRLAEGRGVLSREQFVAGWRSAFDVGDEAISEMLSRLRADATGHIDVIEFTNALPLEAVGPLVQSCRAQGPLYHSALDQDECAALERMLSRLDEIASRAKALDVRLMIDAEHTCFQPAIDHAVLRLSRTHNQTYPCCFGTYQAYLKECETKLHRDLDRASREGWHLGAKLVRGAYMVHERERARELGYPDPIQPTAEATHASYDAAIRALLLHCPCPERTSVMVASHNRSSVEYAARLLLGEESRVPTNRVVFGQLLGMADHLTFTLAAHGLKAYKYVPYGPVREVLPYLIRRAQENADALSGAAEQRNMMLKEVGRRMGVFA